MFELFVTCSEGIELLLQEELLELGYAKTRKGFRGVYVEEADLEAVYAINYQSRLASRVLLPLRNFNCRHAKQLYQESSTIDWSRYIPPGKTFAIDANVSHKLLRNSLFAAQVVKDAICDQLRAKTGKRPSIDVQTPDIQLNLFIREPQAILSFDTSGSPLHKRGYRLETVEAPIQETLAAALVRLMGKQDENKILFDPCCGSGTLLIETALSDAQIAPGFLRQSWGFMRLPEFEQDTWLKVKAQADLKRKSIPQKHYFGCDMSKNAVRACKTNLRAAGLLQYVEIVQQDFRDYTPPLLPSVVLTNPPHGNRLGDVESLRSLYRELGDFLKRKTAKPARGYIFTGSLELAKEVGLAPTRRHVVYSNGEECRFLEFDLY